MGDPAAQADSNAALFAAIDDHDAGGARRALAAGADPNALEGILETPALVKAMEAREAEIVDALLEAGANPNAAGSGKESALCVAARIGAPELVRRMLTAGAAIDPRDDMGMTPLHWAIHWSRQSPGDPTRPGYPEVVRALLDVGADPHVRSQGGVTPVRRAAGLGDPAIVRALLDRGADPLVADDDGCTPVSLALERGFSEVVGLLTGAGHDLPDWVAAVQDASGRALGAWLKKGGDPDATDASGQTVLGWAARLGHARAVKALLAAGAHAAAGTGGSPLLAAARLGRTDAALALVEAGADLRVRDEDGADPLVHAARRGDRALARALLAAGAHRPPSTAAKGKGKSVAKKKTSEAPSAFLHALRARHHDLALELLEAGADYGDGARALADAATTGRLPLVRGLLEAGVEAKGAGGAAVHRAAQAGHAEVVEALLAAGADPDAKDECRWTPLLHAARAGHDRVVAALVAGGASLEARADGFSAVLFAVQAGRAETVSLLLRAGAKLRAKGKLIPAAATGDLEAVLLALGSGADRQATESATGWSALHIAAALGRERVAASLLSAGADVHAEARAFPRTALEAASDTGRADIAERLVKHGALGRDPRTGALALHAAAGNGHAEVIRVLLGAGVDPNACPDSTTALIVAARAGHAGAVDALLNGGADPRGKTALGLTAADEADLKDHTAIAGRLRAAAQARGAWMRPAEDARSAPARPAPPDAAGPAEAAVPTQTTPPTAGRPAEPAAPAKPRPPDPARLAQSTPADAGTRGELTVLDLGRATAEAVAAALDAGADVNARARRGRTPLMLAAAAGNGAVVDLLLERGAERNLLDEGGGTALAYATGQRHEAVALALLRAGADPAAGSGPLRPLPLAVGHRLPELARALVLARHPQDTAKIALVRAIARSDAAAVKQLLAGRTPASQAEPDTKWPALSWACLFGQVEIVRLLLAAKADPDVSKNGWTPLALAYAGRHSSLLQILLDAGADADSSAGPNSGKLLPTAVSEREIQTVDRLLRAGAKADAAMADRSCLHVAADGDVAAAIPLLAKAGAKLEARDFHKRTPLTAAVMFGSDAALAALLEAGAKADAPWQDKGLLQWAAEGGRIGAFRLLLDALGPRAGKVKPDPEGDAPLHAAARRGSLAMVEGLLARGADTRTRNAAGRTPLHEAAAIGHAEMVRALLDAGADPDAEDAAGRTPALAAAEEAESDVLRLLAEAAPRSGAAARLCLAAIEADAAAFARALAGFTGRPPAAALLAAAHAGRAEAVRALLDRKPEGDLAPARGVAEQEGFAAVAEAFAAARVASTFRPPGEGPGITAVDATFAGSAPLDHPLVWQGAFSRYLRGTDTAFAAGAMRGQWADPWRLHPRMGEIDAGLGEAGFAPLGVLVCERIKDVLVRAYGATVGTAYGAWNLGLFGSSLDFSSDLSDGVGLTTTTLDPAPGSAARRSYGRAYPNASPWVLHHKHAMRLRRRAALGAAATPAAPTAEAFAQALDRFLVKRFGPETT